MIFWFSNGLFFATFLSPFCSSKLIVICNKNIFYSKNILFEILQTALFVVEVHQVHLQFNLCIPKLHFHEEHLSYATFATKCTAIRKIFQFFPFLFSHSKINKVNGMNQNFRDLL